MMLAMMVAALSFTACGGDSDDDIDNEGVSGGESMESLKGTWAGSMNISLLYWNGKSYYSYETELTFIDDPLTSTNGYGYWVDHYSDAPWNYVAYHIKWHVNNNVIYILFVENNSSLVIRDYKLNYGDRFVGKIYDDQGNIQNFKLSKTKTPNYNNYFWGVSELQVNKPEDKNSETFTVNGVSFKMICVDGGSFTMGGTSEQGSDAEGSEKPTHSVTLSTYYIGETEVTQELWRAVMGSNPSYFSGSRKPVERVSWDDCQEFIRQLNSLTGQNFRLPTEAEWEFAARGGTKSRGYKYAGSNTIGDVAWYADNSNSQTHDVATKAANELGLYDMSGNVEEFCQDWYGRYSSSSQTNPTGPSSGSTRVYRGGSWRNYAAGCRVSHRFNDSPSNAYVSYGLRLAISQANATPEDESSEMFTVNDISFKMIRVEGGTFTMGGTSEQGSDVDSDEKPTHRVTLSTYYIGETEVTQELWQAVMFYNPSYFSGAKKPVESVSWDGCQEFISKLNTLTGQNFRLPTEAEWEYAARGGNKSLGYKYAGSNTIGDVAWYWDNIPSQSSGNTGFGTQNVATKQANELGLYDMSGNVWEWCQDRYGSYSSSSQTNPTGPSSGSYRVNRGGNWFGNASYCRVSRRNFISQSPGFGNFNLGLRLAL